MSSHQSRMNELLDYLKINSTDLAKSVSVNPESIRRIVRGHKDGRISLKIATKICDKYEDINFSYLLNGRGELIKKQQNVVDDTDSDNNLQYTTYQQNDMFDFVKEEKSNYSQKDSINFANIIEKLSSANEQLVNTNSKLAERILFLTEKLI